MSARESRAMHWLALLMVACTLPLIFVGGLVTTRDAGMSVPDWPTSYGYNMFLFPLSKMVGGIFYEHSHRLIGSLVGMLALVLTLWVWLREPRREVRLLAAAALVGVVIQGVLGGLRVVLVNADLAIVHACMAQLFFCIAIALALVTSHGWQKLRTAPPPAASKLRGLAVATTAAIYAQVILGAFTRHTHTMTGAHIAGAVLVFVLMGWMVVEILTHRPSDRPLLQPAMTMMGLVLAQIVVGFSALVMRATRDAEMPITPLQAVVPTIHVVLGALILGTSVVLTLRAWRMSSAGEQTSFVADPMEARA